jgi:DNA polymerase I
MATSKTLFLLDAYALIFRAYYAFINNPVKNSKGMNTSPMLGFTNSLNEILKKQDPSHIAVAFDFPGPTFRTDIYSEYKTNRPPTPEDIKKAVPYIKNIIRGFNIPIYEIEGYEADDIIGALAKKAENKGYKVYMMTSDKDYCQLVTENISLYKPKRSGNEVEIWGVEEVQKKFLVDTPLQVIDVLSLWGDSVDNVPGIPGIGEKSSKTLINTYKSIENLIEHVDELKPKQRENILANIDQLKISKQLITIHLETPVEFNEKELRRKEPNIDQLKTIFSELEFKNLSERILNTNIDKKIPKQGTLFGHNTEADNSQEIQQKIADIKTTKHDYKLTSETTEITALVELLLRQKEFCFDTETTGLDAHRSELVGISFSYRPHEAFYIPISKKPEERQQLLELLKPVFYDKKITKTGQNIKYDLLILQWAGLHVEGPFFDTMIAHYLLFPGQKHNMDFLAEKYLNYRPVSIETLIGKKGKGQLSMRHVNLDKIKEYAGEDADITLQLKHILEKELEKNNLKELFYDIEMPLVPVLAQMEYDGVYINRENLHHFAEELRNEISKIKDRIIKMAGIDFNIGSPKQLGEVLFDRLKIVKNPKLTKTKQYSTSEQDLIKLADKHEIVQQILDYRSLIKLLTTYVESLPKLIHPKTGKIHTSYNQTITTTGRLSSNNPNLQNIPIRTKQGQKIRAAFVPSENNNVILSADYSQIELRLMAHLSNDSEMINDFLKGEDIHRATAAKIFSVEQLQVTKEMRSQAKSANFGIIYGISAFGLAQNINISRQEAKSLIVNYFKTYPGVKIFMDECIKNARKNGYVRTIKNRIRYLEDINSKNPTVRGMAERNAINTPIQGSAADIIKIAMNNIAAKIKKDNYAAKMILQVHDELVFDCPISEVEKLSQMVKHEMEHVIKLQVPLIVETGTGANWLEAH